MNNVLGFYDLAFKLLSNNTIGGIRYIIKKNNIYLDMNAINSAIVNLFIISKNIKVNRSNCPYNIIKLS